MSKATVTHSTNRLRLAASDGVIAPSFSRGRRRAPAKESTSINLEHTLQFATFALSSAEFVKAVIDRLQIALRDEDSITARCLLDRAGIEIHNTVNMARNTCESLDGTREQAIKRRAREAR
jgi:hypothetical protein